MKVQGLTVDIVELRGLEVGQIFPVLGVYALNGRENIQVFTDVGICFLTCSTEYFFYGHVSNSFSDDYFH